MLVEVLLITGMRRTNRLISSDTIWTAYKKKCPTKFVLPQLVAVVTFLPSRCLRIDTHIETHCKSKKSKVILFPQQAVEAYGVVRC
jgi:hypothetical protein